MTCAIKLTNGGVAYVDDDMAEVIRAQSWGKVRDHLRNKWYARANVRGVVIYMHQVICNADKPDHINGDTLDNRRCNLRPSTASLNMLNTKPSKPERVVRLNGNVVYKSRIGFNNELIYLGQFSTEAVAIRVTELNRRRLLAGLPVVQFLKARSRVACSASSASSHQTSHRLEADPSTVLERLVCSLQS